MGITAAVSILIFLSAARAQIIKAVLARRELEIRHYAIHAIRLWVLSWLTLPVNAETAMSPPGINAPRNVETADCLS
jgi:hypothetical protein